MSSTTTTQSLVRVADSLLDRGRQGLFATVDIEPGTHVLPSIQATLLQISPYPDPKTHGAITYGKIVPPWPSIGNVAMIKHSCTPNVEISVIIPTQTINVYAIQIIQAGDELSAAYCDVLRSREIRHRALQFECHCEDCQLEEDESKASDELRGGIGREMSLLVLFRRSHFGDPGIDVPMVITPAVARSIGINPEVTKLPSKAVYMFNTAVNAGFGDSTLALAHEILAVFNTIATRLAEARESRGEHLDWPTKCLGPDHPRTVNLRDHIENFGRPVAQRPMTGTTMPRSVPPPENLVAGINRAIARISMSMNSVPSASTPAGASSAGEQNESQRIGRASGNFDNREQDGNDNYLQQVGNTPPWAKFNSPIHGLGLRATRNIKAGELIMSAQTTLQIDATDLADPHVFLKAFRDGTPQEKEVLLDAITHNMMPDYGMPLKNMQDFDEALKNDGEDFLHELHEVVPRHFYPFVDRSSTYTFFENAWSLNHSCRPTAEACLDAAGRLGVRAIVDIEEADEITISYIDVYQDRTARETALNFDCNCNACRWHYTDFRAYRQQRKQLSVVSAALTKMRAFRVKYPQSAVELSENAAKNIENDPETSGILKLIERVEESDWVTQGIVTSDFSIFYDVHHFILVARYSVHGDRDDIDKALVCKQHEWQLLERCLGSEHARALAAREEITRMHGV
ncbi:hypothetical protein LTR97_009013 [Elasticomyces elasticus]|uniref:SET domain-containing protein n=1 Tax=Elasticomyces elasticus TaxID=574655 RepID=A0AAN7W6N5_9PEZI|nr:hypothetical protein LTR97_009013 [Elasticomyces elasticus]